MRKYISEKSVDKTNQVRPILGMPIAATILLVLQLIGCSNLSVTDQLKSTQSITTDVQSNTARDEPDCEPSALKRLTIHGGHCVGVGCGDDEYRLNAWLETPDEVYTVRYMGKLSVKGSASWNRSLKASAKSYQNLLRAQNDYRSDLAIQEPVNGPIEGRYSVTFWIHDERKSGNPECVIHRENTFSNQFDSVEQTSSVVK